MKIEKLSKYDKTKIFISGFVICAALFITINLLTSKSKYKSEDNIDLAEGTINYTIPDLNVIAVYVKNDQGTFEKTDAVPSDTIYQVVKGEGDNTSYCINQITGEKLENVYMKYEAGNIDIKINKKGTKCWIYLEKAKTLKDEILPNDEELNIIEFKNSFNGIATTDEGMFKILDYDNDYSYYFRGAVEDNYVKFANFYWRIIRINSDGSIRMIYDGTSTHENGEASNNRQIGTSAYNKNYNDAKYAGLMYGKAEAPTKNYEEANKNEIKSTILTELETWYEENLIKYDNYIEKNAIFCNDRRSVDNTKDIWSEWLAAGAVNKAGYGQNSTAYGPRMRIYSDNRGPWLTTQYADLSCQPNDRFTSIDATRGNKSTKYPIGLITLDEILMAGGFGGKANNNYYLYNGSSYWTISPEIFYKTNNHVLIYHEGGNSILHVYDVTTLSGVRPVINLKANTTFSKGDGSINSPFIVN